MTVGWDPSSYGLLSLTVSERPVERCPARGLPSYCTGVGAGMGVGALNMAANVYTLALFRTFEAHFKTAVAYGKLVIRRQAVTATAAAAHDFFLERI